MVADLCKNIPMQSCEYLLKRLMPPGDNETEKKVEGVRNRIRNLNNQEINQLVEFLHTNILTIRILNGIMGQYSSERFFAKRNWNAVN